MPTWRMFIASSKKGIKYAKAVKSVIDAQFRAEFKAEVCQVWDEGAFKVGKAHLESLEDLTSAFDCGLAVFTADLRAGAIWLPSDSVVLESGLFLGAFGGNRTFVLREQPRDGKVLKIPADLHGITLGEFQTVEGEVDSDYRKAVKPASMKVVERLRSDPPLSARPLKQIEKNWREGNKKKKEKELPQEEFKLFSFYGLRDPQKTVAVWNEQNVYYLWADPQGSSIRARVIPNGLEVEFQNLRTKYPGNVAVRVRKLGVPCKFEGFKYLRFHAVSPPGSPPNVCIGLRVVDALTTHWMHCNEDDNKPRIEPVGRERKF
jgi:hypothetical protein